MEGTRSSASGIFLMYAVKLHVTRHVWVCICIVRLKATFFGNNNTKSSAF